MWLFYFLFSIIGFFIKSLRRVCTVIVTLDSLDHESDGPGTITGVNIITAVTTVTTIINRTIKFG